VLKAMREPKRIVFPEGTNERVIRAALQSVESGIAHPILLGREHKVRARAEALGVNLDGIEILDPAEDESRLERYAQEFYASRQRKGATLEEAREKVRMPLYYSCMMLQNGDADGMIAGEETNYPETIRPALEAVGTAPHVTHVAGLYMMILQHDLVFFADTTVNITPDEFTLAEIALLAAQFAIRLGVTPHMALLSFSNFGSTRHPDSDKVARAVQRVRELAPELVVDGEMQADTAVVPEILQRLFPFSSLQERANVLIFPDLNSANIAYKLLARIGGAEAIGPILLGMAKPVHVLQRGSEAADIFNLTAIAVVDAQERSARDQRQREHSS
jgi:malate dehydrogenase (oxaloacetate-decarboxylating)(NADP+)